MKSFHRIAFLLATLTVAGFVCIGIAISLRSLWLALGGLFLSVVAMQIGFTLKRRNNAG